tara:strand:+ start:35021 stop:35662 length:642 start_codon:yes stop_codon:yes gene_type:complete
MRLLAIDTTGPDCSVALRVAGQADHCMTETIGQGHAERLGLMVEALLAEAGCAPSELTRIGVATGPGSFAGSRIGVAFARGLALATGAIAVGIGNLEAIARTAGGDGPLAILHDAKRGELVLQVRGAAGLSAPERLSLEQAPGRICQLAGPVGRLAGSGAALISLDGFTDTGITQMHLADLLDLAAAADPALALPAPFYARPPDAKLPGGLEP